MCVDQSELLKFKVLPKFCRLRPQGVEAGPEPQPLLIDVHVYFATISFNRFTPAPNKRATPSRDIPSLDLELFPDVAPLDATSSTRIRPQQPSALLPSPPHASTAGRKALPKLLLLAVSSLRRPEQRLCERCGLRYRSSRLRRYGRYRRRPTDDLEVHAVLWR